MEREKIIEIPYYPREYFIPFHESPKRWSVIVAHRRSGKSTASFNHLQRDALKTKESKYAFILPTYKMAKNVIWDIAKEYSKVIPGIDYNEAELTIKYPNGSRITLYGADNPDSLRGVGLWGVVFDEYSQQPSNIFSEIIRPALSDHQGYAVWIGTPKGKNSFWKLFNGFDEDGNKIEDFENNWYVSHLTVDDTKIIPDQELLDARQQMTADEYDQEFNCSFEAAIKGAYYSKELLKAREDKHITKVPHDSALQVHTWWDLGIGDATAILFLQNDGVNWRLIDSYQATGEGLAHFVSVLQEKAKEYNYGYHYAPHDIEVRELGSGKSRKEMAEQLGIKFEVAPNLPIEDGINAVRLRFNSLWIDEENNPEFLHCISLYRKEWDDKRAEFRSKPLHDFTSHFADALRYWAVTKLKSSDGVKVYLPQWKGYNKLK